jgi:transcription initiation factor TFIIH subunit 2
MAAADDEDKTVYRWEQNIVATWDTVQEDEHGNIIEISSERERSNRAKSSRITQSIRRGLIRYMVIALDCSAAAAEHDFRPSRLQVCSGALQKFATEFYDQNPISQLSLILTKDRVAEKGTELSGNAKVHIDKLQSIVTTKGVASLQNTIELALASLRHIPNYGHRELLIIYSSLSTCDPGDIFATIKSAVEMKLRISVISLVSEMYICKLIAEQTGGMCTVALDAYHFSELLFAHTAPPPQLLSEQGAEASELVADQIYIGFPKRAFDVQLLLGFDGKRMGFSDTAYVCPRCHTRTTDIPTQCCVCGLLLNSSSHIARSYHHLFPVPNFSEFTVAAAAAQPASSEPMQLKEEGACEFVFVAKTEEGQQQHRQHVHSAEEKTVSVRLHQEGEEATSSSMRPVSVRVTEKLCRCAGCLDSFEKDGKMAMRCPDCRLFFCVDCDLFIHDSLHNCPGCCR